MKTRRSKCIRAPDPIYGPCPATRYAKMEAVTLAGACMEACKDPTCKLY